MTGVLNEVHRCILKIYLGIGQTVRENLGFGIQNWGNHMDSTVHENGDDKKLIFIYERLSTHFIVNLCTRHDLRLVS